MSYRLDNQMVCSLRLCIATWQIKFKAQPTEIFSVSCALFLVIYYLLVYNFRCSIANIIHLLHPEHHIGWFEFFGNISLFCKFFYQPEKKVLSLLFNICKIWIELTACQQIVVTHLMILLQISFVSHCPNAEIRFLFFFRR